MQMYWNYKRVQNGTSMLLIPTFDNLRPKLETTTWLESVNTEKVLQYDRFN